MVTGILKFSHAGILLVILLLFFKIFFFFLRINIGANQFEDMSLKHQFSTLIGFTEAEFKENYIDIIKFYCEEDYVETELENIKSHYNGYKFSVSETENRLISPVSVIRHLKSSLIIFQSPNHKNEGILVFYYYFHNFLFLR